MNCPFNIEQGNLLSSVRVCQNNLLLKKFQFKSAKVVKSQIDSVPSAPESRAGTKREEIQGQFDFFLIIVEVRAARR